MHPNRPPAGGGLDLSQLSIVAGKTCWVLYCDALVLNMDGNVLDALGLAVKAALSDTRVPKASRRPGFSTLGEELLLLYALRWVL